MTDNLFKRTWAEVNLDVLNNNFALLRHEISKNAKIMAIVKADAYGHGVENTVLQLQNSGADWFGVSSIAEAEQLRWYGVTRPVLILGYTPPQMVDRLVKYSLTQTVYSSHYAAELSKNATDLGVSVDAHIKVDTGMSRLGFDSEDDCCIDEITKVCSLNGINASGIFTHFPSADLDGDDDGGYTKQQFELFMKRIEQLKQKGITFSLRHCCNSAAAISQPQMHLDMVREGISLYGLWPSDQIKKPIDLAPVMELKSVVTMVKDIPAGRTVSYGRTFKTDHPMKIATVCIGYADGYPRSLSNKGEMLIFGKQAPIIGRICMDQLMLDVTDIDGVYEGCEVTVFGKDGNSFLPVERLAELSGTINYEIVCILGKRVPRVYIKDGKTEAVISYINHSL